VEAVVELALALVLEEAVEVELEEAALAGVELGTAEAAKVCSN
jgi:hypothetical protein